MLLVLIRAAQRLLRRQEGGVLPLFAIALPAVLGFAGLAVDATEWTVARRQAQDAADAAAMAGVFGLIQSADPATAATQHFANLGGVDPRAAIQVDSPAPGHESDPYAVRVQVTVPATLTFSSLFLRRPFLITTQAIATTVKTDEYCQLAIGSDDGADILVRSQAELGGDCNMVSNGSSTDTITVESGASVDVKRITAFGGIKADAADLGSTLINGQHIRTDDPLADTEPPLVPNTGCPNVTVNPHSGGTADLRAGCYGNMVLNGPVHLSNGEYILNRGNFIVGPNADVSCDACTIFLTSDDPANEPGSIGKVQIDGGATVHLAGPTDGPDAGIVIYQDRHASSSGNSANKISGNSGSKIQGLIYLPSDTVSVNAADSPDLSCARLIGRRLRLNGHVYFAADCPTGSVIKLLQTEVRLIG